MKLDDATIDRLRELGATDEMLKWLEHPEAVRELLLHPPLMEEYGEAICPRCDAPTSVAHLPMCAVAAAWRTLGDPRGAEDVERAQTEALASDRNRTAQAERARKEAEDRARIRAGIQALTPDEMRKRFDEVRGDDTMEEFAWFALREGYIDAEQARFLAPDMPEGGPLPSRQWMRFNAGSAIRVVASDHVAPGTGVIIQAP